MLKKIEELRRKAAVRNEAAERIESADRAARETGEHQASEVPLGEHRLPDGEAPATVNRMLGADHILAISKAKTKKDGGEPDPLVKAAQAKGLSLRGLARAVEKKLGRSVPVSRLSMARRRLRPIDADIAYAIQKLIGFEATFRNWPGGIQES